MRPIARGDRPQAFDELLLVAHGIGAGHFEKRLRDRQRRAQLVGGVGRESLLLGDLGLEPGEHGIEAVGQLAELLLTSLQRDPVGERSVRRHARGVGDASGGASMRLKYWEPPIASGMKPERGGTCTFYNLPEYFDPAAASTA